MINLWNKQYQFKRDYFVKSFEVLAPNFMNYLTGEGEWYQGEEFYMFREDDMIYLIELNSGVIVNWYKHLGRCNMTNCDL